MKHFILDRKKMQSTASLSEQIISVMYQATSAGWKGIFVVGLLLLVVCCFFFFLNTST